MLKRLGVDLAASGARFDVALDLTNQTLASVPGTASGETRRILREALTDDLVLADGPIGAWKHAAAVYDPEFAQQQVNVLFVVKSPGAWLTSIHRRPYHRLNRGKGTLGQFVKTPWVCVRRELTPTVVSNAVELWNIKVRSYLNFARKAEGKGVSCYFVMSEDLILRQVETERGIAEWLGVEPIDSEITEDTKQKGRTIDDLKRYYGDELWRNEMNDDTMAFVREQVDSTLVSHFNYTS